MYKKFLIGAVNAHARQTPISHATAINEHGAYKCSHDLTYFNICVERAKRRPHVVVIECLHKFWLDIWLSQRNIIQNRYIDEIILKVSRYFIVRFQYF